MVKNLMELPHLSLGFSVSATTRDRRGSEVDGESYHFISPSEFDAHIHENNFVEWEEVYPGLSYGTLCSEVENLWSQGLTPVFDVDVIGGQTLKSVFQDSALLIFVMPPSIEELERRLRFRGTEDEESLQKRLSKASRELEAAPAFDVHIINDDLERAIAETSKEVTEFLIS